ncbi:uncharacterized protein AruCF_5235 [Achromobacter ruhlandii]|nr:uncharacterized protein AruCF_5235 [Achromobacter ruhlandii]
MQPRLRHALIAPAAAPRLRFHRATIKSPGHTIAIAIVCSTPGGRRHRTAFPFPDSHHACTQHRVLPPGAPLRLDRHRRRIPRRLPCRPSVAGSRHFERVG